MIMVKKMMEMTALWRKKVDEKAGCSGRIAGSEIK